ncbi:MAG: hypothetical protein NTX98_00770 [Candidatus Doudnabacteria bacterium]|nr:hypothetical protein [Candidatus Doudnabacteria bacterium]
MTDEKWQQLVGMAKKNFSNVSLTAEDLIKATPEGEKKEGTQDVLIFTHPSGDKYKLVRENRPLVLEKKQHFSHRMGDTARTEYKLSDTEFSHRLKIYKEVGFDDWEEVTLDRLGL